MPRDWPALYLITDRRSLQPGALTGVVEQALSGGVRLVQLREKDLTTPRLIEIGRPLVRLCRVFGARLIVNRDMEAARDLKADGLHVGADDIPRLSALREAFGRPLRIGVSAHSSEEARRAFDAGADFVTLGPVYETPSKAGMGLPLGPETVGRAARELPGPVYALGGVDESRLTEMNAHGIRRVALIRAILTAPDPRRAAESLLARLIPSSPPPTEF